MPQQPQYLSTDPNAGLDTSKYLSTDPNAGLETTPSPTAALGKAQTIKAQPKLFSPEWFREKRFGAESATADVLPTVGATAGAMLGEGWGSVPGAAFGGAAGEAGKQAIRRHLGYPDAPQTPEAFIKDISKQGALQGAMQVPFEALGAWGPSLKAGAVEQYLRALAPTTRETKYLAGKITPEMIARGLHGTPQEIGERAEQEATALRGPLDVAYSQTPASATLRSGTTILQDLDKLQGNFVVMGKIAKPKAYEAIEGVKDIVKQYGADIPPDSLRKLRQIFEIEPAEKGAYAGVDDTTAYTRQAEKAAGDSIRKIMGQANPDIAALNKEMTFWLRVQEVTSATSLRRTGQAGGLLKVLKPLAIASVGGEAAMSHGSPTTGLLASLGTTASLYAYEVSRRPEWQTLSAVAKDRIASSLAKGNIGDAMAFLTRVGVAARQTYKEAQKSAPQPTPQSK